MGLICSIDPVLFRSCLVALAIGGMMISCDECDPEASKGTTLIMSIYTVDDEGSTETVEMDTILGVQAIGAEIQSAAAIDTVNDQMYLFLDQNEDFSQFVIYYKDDLFVQDTITYHYGRIIRSNPPNCSLLVELVQLEATGTYDSVVINKSIIDREGDENAAVFIRI